MRTQRILLSPDAVEGGSTTNTETPQAVPSVMDAKATAILLKKQAELEGDNKKYRSTIRALKEELATARESASNAPEVDAELAAYRALGKPDALKVSIGEASALKREKSLGDIARKAGVPPEKVPAFFKIAGDSEFDVKDDANGPVVSVKDGDRSVPFDEFFAEFLPAIKPDPRGGPRGTPSRDSHQRPDPDDHAPRGRAGERPLTPQEQLLKSNRYLGVR